MFFSVFWTVYIPIVTIISAGIGDWLTHSLRQRRAHAASGVRRIDRVPPMSRGLELRWKSLGLTSHDPAPSSSAPD
jgi:hypothetical protein